MKKTSIYLMSILCIIIFITLYSCDGEKTESKNTLARSPQEIVVGEFDALGNFIITAKESILLENWNTNLSILSQINAELTSIRVFKDGTEYYLMASGAEYSSTIPLIRDGINGFGGGVACTSKVCSGSSTGCVPKSDGLSCTACSAPSNDCTKTVTSLSLLVKQF